MPGQFRELLPQPSGRDALEGVHQPGQLHRRGIGDEQVDVLRLPVALHQVATEVSADRLKDVFQPGQVGVGEDRMAVLRHENQVGVQ